MTQTKTLRRLVCGLGLLGWVLATPALAQVEDRVELEERIREHFSNMLRSELSLSDSQADVVLPAMTDLELHKRELATERRKTARALQVRDA